MKTNTIYIYNIETYICAVKNTDRNANVKSFAIEDERLKSLAPVNQRYTLPQLKTQMRAHIQHGCFIRLPFIKLTSPV